jgi:hypothetical protein
MRLSHYCFSTRKDNIHLINRKPLDLFLGDRKDVLFFFLVHSIGCYAIHSQLSLRYNVYPKRYTLITCHSSVKNGTVILTTLNESYAALVSGIDLFFEIFRIGKRTRKL